MKQIDFFYRNLNDFSFIHDNSSLSLPLIPCISKNPYTTHDMYYSIQKKTWIKAESPLGPKSFPNSIAIEYAEKSDTVVFPKSISDAEKNHMRFLGRLAKKVAELKLNEQNIYHPYGFEDYSTKEMTDFLNYRTERARSKFAKSNIYDKEKIKKSLYAVEVGTDYDNLKVYIKTRYYTPVVKPIETNTYDSKEIIKTLSFDVKNGKINLSVSPDEPTSPNDSSYSVDDNLQDTELVVYDEYCKIANQFVLPFEIAKFALERLIELAKTFTGYQLKIDEPKVTSHALQTMVCLTMQPFEYKICPIIYSKYVWPATAKLNRSNPNIYNKFCKTMHIKSYRSLRKAYEKRPESLLTFLRIKKCRFSDANIFNKILADRELYNFFDSSDNKNLKNDTDLAFFCRISKKQRGELSTFYTLEKSIKNDYFMLDSLSMFHDYYRNIPKTLIDDILKDGFTEFNHNALTNISYKCENKYIKFRYTKNEKKLEDSIDGYKFMLPADSNKLCEIGAILHNCVATYTKKVKRKECTIVYAEKNGEVELCIEVVNDEVNQELTKYNSKPTEEQTSVLKKWHDRHNLK